MNTLYMGTVLAHSRAATVTEQIAFYERGCQSRCPGCGGEPDIKTCDLDGSQSWSYCDCCRDEAEAIAEQTVV